MRIAAIGTGPIVDTFLSALDNVEGADCIAMYTRPNSTSKAESLAAKYNVKKIYTDLEEMYSKPDIDFVYIASPNSLHFEQAFKALQHGKNVICEKPFTSTVREAEKLIELAKENNLMLFEAISNIHLPNFRIVEENLKLLGDIKVIQCNYSQLSSRYLKLLEGEIPNIFNPEFSGGALSDLNIYNLHFVIKLFGQPEKVQYTANKHSNGIDTSGIVTMEYSDFVAQCVGSKDTNSMNFILIQGENGFIHVVGDPNSCTEVLLHLGDKKVKLNNQAISNRLYYELETFNQIYKEANYVECYSLLDHSLSVMETYEKAREDGGIVFAVDKQE